MRSELRPEEKNQGGADRRKISAVRRGISFARAIDPAAQFTRRASAVD